MTTYRAAIFDFGGVLTTSPTQSMRTFCESNNLPWESVGPLLGSHEGAWSRFETNVLTQEGFIAAFEAECAELGHTIDGARFLGGFFAGMTLRPDMVAVVRSLRERMKVGCITNNVQVSGRERLVVFEELFDAVIESSKVGLRKPNPAIYQLACDALGVAPSEAIFLDDFGVNLKAARALGMATIKVDESQSAIAELEQLLSIQLPRQGEPNHISAQHP